MNRYLLLLILIVVIGCQTPSNEPEAVVTKEYSDLVSLFKEWRTFENPPLLDGAPDYREATFKERWPDFKKLQSRLLVMDTTGWSVPEQVDYHIVWAEMNGYDFNDRILKPWQRDPAYYKTIWMQRSDVPAHEGPTNHGAIDIWKYEFPLSAEDRTRLLKGFESIPAFNEQAKKNLTGNAKDLWIAGIRDIRNQIEDLKAYFENKLQEQKNNNEEKDRILKKLQHIIVDYDKANNKDAMDNEKAEGIEDDVQQNSQDIEELRIEVYHQEDILNRVSADLKNLNNTFEEAILFIDETRPPVGSIIAWLPQLSDKKEIPQG